MKTIDLGGGWQFKAVDTCGTLPDNQRSVTSWMKGTVPGTVHTDLMANGKIPDPFFRMHENDVQWVESVQWVYRREMVIPDAFLLEDVVRLVAQGLDTYAEIRCNGRVIGRTENMFVDHEFDVTRHIRRGRNTLEIIFDSPVVRSKRLEKRFGALRVALEPHRVYIRKAQYSFGWDWGPKLTTSGIWKDLSIQAFSAARLRHPFVKVVSVNAREAIVELSVEVEGITARPPELRISIGKGEWSFNRTMSVKTGHVKFRTRIPRPRIWWPNGYGEQPLYTAVFTLAQEGAEIHNLSTTFALRTVRLIQKKDAQGSSFIFEINGTKIFCKGGDWIPSDSFLPRIANTTYERLLQMARDAHMNMIRVWGGGIYEKDIFYELCDRLGLMVWQDFMFACGEYPEEPWLLAQVKDEARKVVLRLRNHPSIVIWCGNNECEWNFCKEQPGRTADEMRGARIFRDLLPAVCRDLDGTRPYWRSSPFGKGSPNDESNGVHHQWQAWGSWKDFPEYENDRARFVTEFGFQAPANRHTLSEAMVPDDQHPQSPVMEHHNKLFEGTERLFRFQAAHYRMSDDFDRFIFQAQLLQAEALKCAVEHWRRRKFKTAGALFWQLNDCWPVSSWSVIDSDIRPKAAYYYARKFFAPLLLSIKRSGIITEVWITNDLMTSVTGQLALTLRSFEGKDLWSRRQHVRIPRNTSRNVAAIEPDLLAGIDRFRHYLHAQLRIDGEAASENRMFFAEPKHLVLPTPGLRVQVRKDREHVNVLTVHTDVLVKNMRVEFDGEDPALDDNFFDIDPGSSKEIRFNSGSSLRQLRKKLRLCWL